MVVLSRNSNCARSGSSSSKFCSVSSNNIIHLCSRIWDNSRMVYNSNKVARSMPWLNRLFTLLLIPLCQERLQTLNDSAKTMRRLFVCAADFFLLTEPLTVNLSNIVRIVQLKDIRILNIEKLPRFSLPQLAETGCSSSSKWHNRSKFSLSRFNHSRFAHSRSSYSRLSHSR